MELHVSVFPVVLRQLAYRSITALPRSLCQALGFVAERDVIVQRSMGERHHRPQQILVVAPDLLFRKCAWSAFGMERYAIQGLGQLGG